MKQVIVMLFAALMINIAGCSSTSSGGTSTGGDEATGGGKSFSESGGPITIDDIVNGSGSSQSVNTDPGKAVTSADAAFYFGRFIYWSSYIIYYTGSVKFKLNKVDGSSAYFSDFTLEHYSRVTDYDAHNDIVTSSTDLQVSSSYNSATNHVEIANATERFVDFDLDFGNNDYFGDITNAGVVFSSDFSTMAGGNDASFFFIAQKVDSQPDVSISAITGDWNTSNFTVSSYTGNISIASTSTIDVGGTGGNGFTAFTGATTGVGNIDGELSLTDATSGAFVFGFGSGDGSVTAQEISGGFLVSADQSLAVGISVGDSLYFAAER